MIIDGIDFAVKYVDPTLPDLGSGNSIYTGDTPATAYREIPTLVNNTCYIVRRTDSYAKFPAGASNVVNFCVIGMMKSPDDKFASYIPEEARTAWLTDSAEKAMIKFDRSGTASPDSEAWTNASKHYAVFTALKYMNFYGCRLCRTSACGANTEDGPGLMLSVTSVADKIIFDNCEFGYENIMLRDYGKDHTNIDANSKIRYSQYFGIGEALAISITNCYIDAACVCASDDSSGGGSTRFLTDFSVRTNVKNFNFSNNEVYSLGNIINTFYNHYIQYNTDIIYITQVINANICDNNIYFVHKNNEHNARSLICATSSWGKLQFVNNTFSLYAFKDCTSNPYTGRSVCELLNGFAEMYVKNITYNFDNELIHYYHGTALHFEMCPAAAACLSQRNIEDVTIKFYTADTSIISTDLAKSAITLAPSANYSPSYNSNYDGGAATYLPNIAKNINIETNGVAIAASYFNLKDITIKGSVHLNVCCYFEGTIHNHIDNDLRALYLTNNGGNIVRLKELTYVNTADTQIVNNTSPADPLTGNNVVLVDTAPTLPFNRRTQKSSNETDRYAIQICYNFEDGKFFAKDEKSYAESYAMTSTYSASNTMLKICNNNATYDNTNSFKLGMVPLLNGLKIPVTDRKKVDINVHIGVYNIPQSELLGKLVFNFIDPDTKAVVASSTAGVINIDTGVQYADTNVTAYKLRLTDVDLSNLKSDYLNMEIDSAVYSADGYIYIDPKVDYRIRSDNYFPM